MGENDERTLEHGADDDAEHRAASQTPTGDNGGKTPGHESSDEADEETSGGNPAKLITMVVVVLLVLLVAFYALSDALAPSSSRGTVRAHVVQIAPSVSGRVTKVWVENNAVVEAGDPLFSIKKRPYKLAVQKAQAKLKTGRQNVQAARPSVAAAKAAVTRACRPRIRPFQGRSHPSAGKNRCHVVQQG